jgi:hypothetical protein
MQKYITVIILIGSVFGLSRCGQNTEEQPKKEMREAPVMYQQSDLAALMHEVHDLSAEWKRQLENGEELTPVPEWIHNMLSAEATNPEELADGAFELLAKEYLLQLEKLAHASGEDRKHAFNNSIQTCISCHKIYCNGPIPKIKKLAL